MLIRFPCQLLASANSPKQFKIYQLAMTNASQKKKKMLRHHKKNLLLSNRGD